MNFEDKYEVLMDENGHSILVEATTAEIRVDGLIEYVRFLNVNGDIVSAFRLSAIRGFFKHK